MLQPIITLVLWTLIVLVWLYAKRIPAMQAAKIDPDKYRLKDSGGTSQLPSAARAVADNYNHLHEAPTVFYALSLAIQIGGLSNPAFVGLAWVYVILRIVHSLIQANEGKVVIRFSVFILSQMILIIMAILAAMQVF